MFMIPLIIVTGHPSSIGSVGDASEETDMYDPTPPYIWRPAFLNILARMGTIAGAARAVGVSVTVVNNARRRDVEFDVQCQEAVQYAVEWLEQIAWDRAARHSDQLLIFLLKAHKPEVYNRATRNELSGPDGGPIPVKAYIGFDPTKWNGHVPGERVQTIEGDFVVIPEERSQVVSSD